MKIGFFGPQGSGKTFIAMLISRLIKRNFPEITVYTNINTDGVVTITDLADIPFDRTPKIVLIDEAMFSISSRASSTNVNELWTRAFAYFRKINVIMAGFMTHRPSMIEVRIREQLDYVMMCRKNPEYFDYLIIDMVAQYMKPLQVPKTKRVFDFASYDTHDFPMPIEVIRLQELPMFQLIKIERKKVKTGEVARA